LVIKLKYNKLVVGHTIGAQLYSFLNNTPIIMGAFQRPYSFERLDEDVDTSLISLQPERKTLNTPEGPVVFGNSKQQVWDHLMFMNSIAGLAPLVDKVSSIRLIDDNNLKIITKRNAAAEVYFKKLIVFNHDNFKGLPLPENEEKEYLVIDWMNVSSTKHDLDMIETNDAFVNKIIFYPSKRIMGHHPNRKDLVSISHLSKKELHSYDHSDTYVKFKVLDTLGKLGIRGPRNGKKADNPEKHIHYRLKLDVTARDVTQDKMHHYKNLDTISFNYQTEKDIIKESRSPKKSYIKKLSNVLFNGKSATK
tara:strand:+ start:2432 stop:3352 length:921 start_codon:yes stop_codon:yes gene_type:complete